MKTLLLPLLLLTSSFSYLFAQNEAPQISYLVAVADTNGQSMRIQYDLTDPEETDIAISLLVSNDGGASFSVNTVNATGDLGFPITPGTNRSITWNYGAALEQPQTAIVKLIANDFQEVDIQSIVDQVDSTRLLRDLSFVQGVRHYQAGAEHLEAVKAFIENQFRGEGLYTERQAFDFANTTYEAHNILGDILGINQAEKKVLVDAHYDSVSQSPGADDNGSGTVGMLECMRVLAPYVFNKSVRFVGFDLEEVGLLGSIDYVVKAVEREEEILGVMNLEMIGYYTEEPNSQKLPLGFELLYPDIYEVQEANEFRGDFLVNAGNTFSTPLMNLLDSCTKAYVPDLKISSIALPGNAEIAPDFRRSDHAPFWDAGYQSLMLTDGSEFRTPHYHQPSDTIGHINFTFMSNIVKSVVATACELAEIQHATAATTSVETNWAVGLDIVSNNDCQFELRMNMAAQEAELLLNNCASQDLQVNVYNINGQSVFTAPIQGTRFSLSLPAFRDGVYLVEVNGVTKKLVVF